MRPSRKLNSSILVAVLLGVVVRSLVASGLMVVTGDGLTDVSLVICPTQNPSLNVGIFSDSHEHGHGAHLAQSDPENPEVISGLHAKVLDNTCFLWVSSSTDTAWHVSVASSNYFQHSNSALFYRKHFINVPTYITGSPRGPPPQSKPFYS